VTDGSPPPVVATAGAEDPSAPLVVLLHGRGSHEREILTLTGRLPAGRAYAAVRALEAVATWLRTFSGQ
jgi:phospholipase/carboxylesterase